MPSVTAVVAAAGSGERLGAGGPKAFVPVAGRPLVEWSLEAFRQAEDVRSIVVACPPGRVDDVRALGSGGVDLVAVDGGATRSQSVRNALAAVETEVVAIHDAARPLVTAELVEAVVATLVADPKAAGAIAATPVVDTIKRASAHVSSPDDRRLWSSPTYSEVKSTVSVRETVDRAELWAAQTPQAFRTAALREALEAYPEDGPEPTDEAMLVEAAGGRVLLHRAPGENLKVTTPFDLQVVELLLSDRAR
ncbi:MAG TPA: 2-C-methyl-D-erythritol 4-phosphate cytidylyltransferase [Solirubrobacterales bacterium]|nr:2-C-methyl-D-erythritol 4-phosphate cytidylyltransferase [Solirubrobacterales bacterium]